MIRCVLALLLVAMTVTAFAQSIPLAAGTVITYAGHDKDGDYESLFTTVAVDDDLVTTALVSKSSQPSEPTHSAQRRVRRDDLAHSHRLIMTLQSGDPDIFPGATLSSLSGDVVKQLRSDGEAPFIVGSAKLDRCLVISDGALGSLLSEGRKYFRGPLRRVAGASPTYSVLVNGERRALPALALRAELKVGDDHIEPEFLVLDDPDNAIILSDSGANAECSARVVRIDFPASTASQAPVETLSKALAAGDCRAELHGIYFATGSADLLPPSASTLSAVAEVLKSEPAWMLSVDGHTDNIGDASYNLDLSARRANAVRDALVTRYHAPSAHLVARGFGLTKPVETNDTLEGRARNRRVELTRQCP